MRKSLLTVCGALAASAACAYTATFICDWKNPVIVETDGPLVTAHPYNMNGKMFAGWKGSDGKIYRKWQETTIDRDMRFVIRYEPLDISIWTNGSDAVARKHPAGNGILYALGDSLTYGTKVGGNGGAWPGIVARRLGIDCVNDGRAGSRLATWRSVLTKSGNHNQYIDTTVSGVTRERMMAGISRAGIIAFSLGTNDILYKNKGEDIAYRMFEFVEALHHEKPDALIMVIGGRNFEQFRDGGAYAAQRGELDKLYEILRRGLNGPKYNAYCVYVDITDILSEHGNYTPCEGKPDGVHPGYVGHSNIADRVTALIGAPSGTPNVRLPSTRAMWNLADAGRLATATREMYALNGLWAFKPAEAADGAKDPPSVSDMDFFFKVPGIWPSADAHVKNGMAVYDRSGADVFPSRIRTIDAAWYGRTITVPPRWSGRDVVLGFRWIPTAVTVYLDGVRKGDIRFPGGELVLGDVAPGEHELVFFTAARIPETAVTAFDAPDAARTFSKKRAANPGINGDITLAAEPRGTKIDNVQVRPSVRRGRIDFNVELSGGDPGPGVTLTADVLRRGRRAKSFSGHSLLFGGEWKDADTWDLDTPGNLYAVKVRLEKDGRIIDELYPETFGFREIALKGRDVLLNGSPVHFRPCNTEYSRQSAVANEDIRKASASRRAFGFNAYVPTANYGFAEGDVTTFEILLREATQSGMAMIAGLPHPNRFDDPARPHHWKFGPAYDRIVRYMVKRLQNIPGLIFWSSTHNATGYENDQNPEIISGRPDEIPADIVDWRRRFRKLALTVDGKMRSFDPTRPVYHHESGALGSFYTINCYLNWAPIQERSDWFEHWERNGTVPLLVVEWGTPHIASWSTFRGGPDGVNIWSARDWTQHCWMNEYNAALLGERAFRTSPAKRMLVDRTHYNAKGNRPCYYGGNFSHPLLAEADTDEVLSLYARRNYRDLRARGVTSFLPWDIDGGAFFTNNPARPAKRKLRTDRLEGLKAFGVVKSDYTYGLFDQADELPRKAGQTLRESYTDILGWIAGPAGREFTRVDDAFLAGERVEKSLVILNDTRRDREIDWVWTAGTLKRRGSVRIAPGGRADIPVVFTAGPDTGEILAGFRCTATGWKKLDRFRLRLMPPPAREELPSEVALFDPDGTAAPLFRALGVSVRSVQTPPRAGLFVIGRNALPKLPFCFRQVAKAGVKTVILEQSAATLKKLGFRVQEYGLRNLFALAPEFSSLDLDDWRGDATLLSGRLDVDKSKSDWAVTRWEGFPNRRVWRAGNRGVVASVLPEKPTKGDFMPLVHGGFNLQYAPVMEYTEPGVRVVLSQLDLCGRTETGPEATAALAKILAYAARAMPNAGTADVRIADARTSDEELRARAARGEKILQLGPFGGGRSYPDIVPELATEPLFRGISNADLQWSYPDCVGSLAKTGGRALSVERIGKGVIVRSAVSPACFDPSEIALRVNRRRAEGLVTRLVANLGGATDGSFLTASPSLYHDEPRQDDDPYRYYRW